MHRGEIWWADLPEPAGRRPVLILTRESALSVRNAVTVAMLTRTIRGIPVEVGLDEQAGVPTECVVNCDNLLTVPKDLLTDYVCTLSAEKLREVHDALCFALELSSPQNADLSEEPHLEEEFAGYEQRYPCE